jgi:hypothetical protein
MEHQVYKRQSIKVCRLTAFLLIGMLLLTSCSQNNINKAIEVAKNCLTENPDGIEPDEMFYIHTLINEDNSIYKVVYGSYSIPSSLWSGVVVIDAETFEPVDVYTNTRLYNYLSPEDIVQFTLKIESESNADGTDTVIHSNKKLLKDK